MQSYRKILLIHSCLFNPLLVCMTQSMSGLAWEVSDVLCRCSLFTFYVCYQTTLQNPYVVGGVPET